MSILYAEDFEGKTSLPTGSMTFTSLFYNCQGLISAENLLLPATTLRYDCYRHLFGKCTSLTSAPQLPATNLVGNCYLLMFYSCTSLAIAPALPATSLAAQCYY